MRIAQVIGKVTLSQAHPSLHGLPLRVVVPLSLSELTSGDTPEAAQIVAADELGAATGSRVALSEGAEAAQPFRPEIKPVDAYCAAILDYLDIDVTNHEETSE